MADIEQYEEAMLDETRRNSEEADAEYWKKEIPKRRARWEPTCDESDIGGLDGADF